MQNLVKRRLHRHLRCLHTDDLEDAAGLGVLRIWSSSGVEGYLRVPEEFEQNDLVMVALDKGLPGYAVWPVGEGCHDGVIQGTDKVTCLRD